MKAFALNVLAFLVALLLAVPIVGGLIYVWFVYL